MFDATSRLTCQQILVNSTSLSQEDAAPPCQAYELDFIQNMYSACSNPWQHAWQQLLPKIDFHIQELCNKDSFFNTILGQL